MVPPKRTFTAEEVGKVFAMRYYLVLKNSPMHHHKVYKADSKIKRPGLDGIMRDFTLSDIDLDMLSSGGFRWVTVTSVTSQDSQSGGVFVVVDGYITTKERRARYFTQAFFLAPQGNGNYYASNDLFKFVDISEASQSIFTAYNGENVPETEQVADESSRVFEPNDDLEDVSKISDATVVTIGQGQHASSPDTIKGNNLDSQVVTEDAAIYVTNLPPCATFAMVEKAFKRFGEIIRDGSEVRHKWRSSYGFVEFKETNAAQKALEASPILIGRCNACVEKKRRAYRSDREQMRIHEEEERQYNQNRYGSDQVRGREAFNFWEWKMKIDEQMKKLQEQEEEKKSRN